MSPRPLFVALLLACLAPAPAHADFAPGVLVTNLSLAHSTGTRTYDLYAPTGYTGDPTPLVIDLHGLGSNGDEQRFISAMHALADVETFVIAWPDGTTDGAGADRSWNGGPLCCNPAQSLGLDDVDFIKSLVAEIAAQGNVDLSRVYATGLSNGGAMSQRLACDAADVFAATVPLAFPIPYSPPMAQCSPSRPMPVLTFQGLTDVLVPYLGFPGFFPAAQESFQRWRDLAGCGSGAPDVHVDLSLSSPPETAFCDTYTSCDDGVQIGLCSVTGIDFPTLPFLNGHILYLTTDGLNVPGMIWDFMAQFQLPASDSDGDGIDDDDDNCPFVPNPDQLASTQYPVGCACLCGDPNRDCVVNVSDAPEAQRAGLIPPLPPLSPDFDPDFCDLNQDGACNVGDAPEMQRAGLVPPLPPLSPMFSVTGCAGYGAP